MNWSVERVKITLREADSGQTVVIEQEPGHTSPKVKTKGKEPDAEPARPKGDGESKAAKEPAKEPAPRAKKAAKRSSAAKVAAAPRARKATTLKWKPVRDHDYEGIGAKSGDGMFKILHAKNTQYALFYDVMGVDSAALGCFRKLENAKARAQEHHDKGFALPKKTAEQIRNVCPVDAPAEDDEDNEKTAEAATAESAEAANEAAGDADYMQALESVLEKQLNGH